jgi:hypothetical protein
VLLSLAPSVAGLDPTYEVQLWDTSYFQGVGGEWFWGTAYWYQATNEANPSSDWYFVGLKFHRQNPIGGIHEWAAWMDVIDNNYRTVYQVDAQPWFKDPLSGDYDLSVGTGGASVTAHLESNGYDRGAWYTGANWAEFAWRHVFTGADQGWGMKSGAQVSKVQETSGNSNANGAFVIWYRWSGWDWGCWCDLVRDRYAEWSEPRVRTYVDATPGS